MKKILIIGCGLLGSSLLRRISKKKIAKKIFIYEKSKTNIAKIKKLRNFLRHIIFFQTQFQQIFCYLILKNAGIQQNFCMKNLKIRELF